MTPHVTITSHCKEGILRIFTEKAKKLQEQHSVRLAINDYAAIPIYHAELELDPYSKVRTGMIGNRLTLVISGTWFYKGVAISHFPFDVSATLTTNFEDLVSNVHLHNISLEESISRKLISMFEQYTEHHFPKKRIAPEAEKLAIMAVEEKRIMEQALQLDAKTTKKTKL